MWGGIGLCFLMLGGLLGHGANQESWANWRGPHQNGSSNSARPPLVWSESENVRWKVAVPGKGHSTPIVWGDKVLVTTAIPVGEKRAPVRNLAPGAHDNFLVEQDHQYGVMAFDLQTGRLLWERGLARAFPHEGGHYTGSLASPSPVTDGSRIYVSFGSQGLFALDWEGKLVWQRDMGRMDTRHAHGEGSSPALKNGVLVINWDHEKQSRIVAYAAEGGDVLWERNRDENTSWSTPLIVTHEGKNQVIVSATTRVRSYDLEDGQLIWEAGGLARNVVASPVAVNGVVIVGNSYDHQAMMAIELSGAQGDLTGTSHILWSLDRMTPYVPSPLIYKGTLYFLRHNQAVLSCRDPVTGKTLRGPYRLAGLREVFASPVAADDRIYVVDRSGATLVMSHGPEPQVLGLNRLDDRFSASPVPIGEALILRGENYLYCLGNSQEKK